MHIRKLHFPDIFYLCTRSLPPVLCIRRADRIRKTDELMKNMEQDKVLRQGPRRGGGRG